ncbi:hypothetical protein HD596_010230 [Nonomuraea jabiensis]|uniref:Core-binding (CB) domain-containing protein n=1 Tax=Nonomuraea jabiensis TaxID=882448 RepID=A0A7W9GGP2_9ACTN|nr:hypothetical protein [Nonomuraea jabiensis]
MPLEPTTQTFATKTDAEVWLTKIEAQILEDDWIDPDAGKIAFGKYAGAWINERPGLRPRTVELYGSLLRRHIAPTPDSRGETSTWTPEPSGSSVS